MQLSADDEARLAELVQAGRAAWPDIDVAAEIFASYIRERLLDASDPARVLPAIHAGDLYLACACGRGDSRALAAFEHHFLAPATARLAAGAGSPSFADEVAQRLRTRLLVAEGEEPPRIASYRGQGPLSTWLAAAAARVAVDVHRAGAHAAATHDPVEELAVGIASAGVDPELGYLKARYGREVEGALRAALATLSPREANVLQLYFLEETTAEALARMYRVTRRTIHRWLEDIRVRVMNETQRVIQERLQVSPAELESLIALVRSQVAVSVHGLPAPTTASDQD